MVPEAGVDGPTYRLARAGEGRDVSLWGLVPEAGLEPARFLRRGILNPLCLPISPHWRCEGRIIGSFYTPSILNVF